MTYIALLRGINVSGQKLVRMAELAELFESLRFTNVRTYLQSGNVCFDHSSADTGRMSGHIGDAIRKRFGFSVPVLVRTAAEWKKLVSGNPFVGDPSVETDKLHVTCLSEVPEDRNGDSLESLRDKKERLTVVGRDVYLYCPNGYGRTKLNNTNIEKRLKVVATTRNWKTTAALLKMIREKGI